MIGEIVEKQVNWNVGASELSSEEEKNLLDYVYKNRRIFILFVVFAP